MNSIERAIAVVCLMMVAISIPFFLKVMVDTRDILKNYQQVQARDNMEYQIMLEADSIVIWDNTRYVGSLPYDDSKLDSLLRQDNE